MIQEKIVDGIAIERHNDCTRYTMQPYCDEDKAFVTVVLISVVLYQIPRFVSYVDGVVTGQIIPMILPYLRAVPWMNELLYDTRWYDILLGVLQLCITMAVVFFLLYLLNLLLKRHEPQSQIVEICPDKLIVHKKNKKNIYDSKRIEEASIFNKYANVLKATSNPANGDGGSYSDISRRIVHYTSEAKDALLWTIRIRYESSYIPVLMHLRTDDAEALFADFTTALFKK